MVAIIPGSQCRAPVAITERSWLDATDGPIQHLQTSCLSKHWRTPRAEPVELQWPATPAQPRDPAKLLGPGAAGASRQHRRCAGR
jgi:hypothetical protein